MNLNTWYLLSIVLIGLALVSLILFIAISIGPLVKTTKKMKLAVDRMKEKQVNPLLIQVNQLSDSVNHLKNNVDANKQEVLGLVNSFKDVKYNVTQLMHSSKYETKQVINKIKNDPQKVEETEQYIQAAFDFMKKYR